MYAFEFRTRIRNGKIEIPKKHRGKIRENVKVIVIAEETPVETDYIEQLFNRPIKLKEFKPLSRDEIYEWY